MIIEHDGITQSVEGWALDYGIPSETIRKRLQRGWKIADAIETPVVERPSRPARPHVFDGKALTLAQWAEVSGVNENTLRSRLRLGWSIGRALTEKAQLSGHGPRRRGGGYLPNSANRLGTGGGSSAQDSV